MCCQLCGDNRRKSMPQNVGRDGRSKKKREVTKRGGVRFGFQTGFLYQPDAVIAQFEAGGVCGKAGLGRYADHWKTVSRRTGAVCYAKRLLITTK